ncbi:MAG: ribbon-helix-helix protein, CopG family [Candidatus Bathyarchaeia archaeon]
MPRKTAIITFSIPFELLSLVDEFKRKTGISRSELIRQSIIQGLANIEKLGDKNA